MLSEKTQRRIIKSLFTPPGEGGRSIPALPLPAIFAAVLGVLVSVFPTVAYPDTGFADRIDISGRLSTETWLYPQSAAYPGQRSYAGGLALETTFHIENGGGTSVTLTPFLRYDAGDPDRTRADFREAYLLMYGDVGDDEWELRLGVDQVFWGVAELRSLVDIINQTDVAEHPNEKIKMGQPMAHLTWSGDWGALEFFAMTWHRARTYPGRRGRQRYELVVDQDMISYESGAKKWHIDLAGRYSGLFGPLDIGLSVFNGTNREPTLLPRFIDSEPVFLAPYYEKIRQFGVDAQLTKGSLLLKLEAIYRAGGKNSRFIEHLNNLEEEDYAAFILGSEYTFYSIWDSNSDLVLFAEWAYDGRGRWATNALENDLFLAARLGLNDPQSTEFIVSVLGSLDSSSRVVAGEFKRRLSDSWFLHIETSVFLDIDEDDFIYYVRRDSFIKVNLAYSF